jgi:hypothetical protein
MTLVADWTADATLGVAPDGQQIITALCKRTYQFDASGRIWVSDEQEPLCVEQEHDIRDDRATTCLVRDLDIYPYKMLTDVVVAGKVYAPGGRAARMRASVMVENQGKTIDVLGNRRVIYRPGQPLAFTEPEPFEVIDLEWWRAYGGIDTALVWPEEPENLLELIASTTPEDRPGAYPRNPSGMGYVVEEHARSLQGLGLPNFEDPANRLRPETFLVVEPEYWSARPSPAGFGWISMDWYPRAAFCGVLPMFPAFDDDPQLEEVRLGWIPRGHTRWIETEADLDTMILPQLANGAASGLRMPYLRGDEVVRITGLSPEPELVFRLAGQKPKAELFFRRQALETRVVLHTVFIDTEARRYTMLWAAQALTPRQLPVGLRHDDPEPDFLEGLDILIDGQLLEHGPSSPAPEG